MGSLEALLYAMSLTQFLNSVDGGDPLDTEILEAAEEFCKSKGLRTPASLNGLTDADIQLSYTGGNLAVKSFLIRAARVASTASAPKRQHMPSPPQMDMSPLPPAPEDAAFLPDVDDGTGDPAEAQDTQDTEQYLRHMLNTLRENMLAEIDAALARVSDQSQRPVKTNCTLGVAALPEIPPCPEMVDDVRVVVGDPALRSEGAFNVSKTATAVSNDVVKLPPCWSVPGQADREPEIEPDAFQLRKAAALALGEPKMQRIFTASLRDNREEDMIKSLFSKIDTDGSGDVSKTEFIRAFKSDDVVIDFCRTHEALKPLLNYKSFKRAFEAIDLDESETISLDEFRKAIDAMAKSNAELAETFDPGEIVNRSAFRTEMHGSALDQEVYDVSKFYHEEGLCQRIARHDAFQNITLAVIVVNAMYIGIDIEHNLADSLFEAHWFFILSECLFLVFFSFEIGARFGAFKEKLNCLKDGWFKFDSILVLLMVLETIFFPVFLPLFSSGSEAPPTGFLRLLRLLRLSRLVRLLRSVPELVTIVKGMKVAIRAVTSTFVMIVVLIYVFAILLMLLLRDDSLTSEYFSTLGLCMWTLLIQGMVWDSTGKMLGFLMRGKVETSLAIIVFFLFVLLTTITVLNLLVGVLVDVVSTVAHSEKEELETNIMKEKILYELKQFDDGDGLITEEELNEVMVDPLSVMALERIGVDVSFLQYLQVMTYENPDAQVPMHDILDQMLTCRQQTQPP